MKLIVMKNVIIIIILIHLKNINAQLISDKNFCIDNCTKDNNYYYEYNNTCYKQCPIGTQNIINKK